jgi:hypothetical protein
LSFEEATLAVDELFATQRKDILLGWAKEIRTTKSQAFVAQGNM